MATAKVTRTFYGEDVVYYPQCPFAGGDRANGVNNCTHANRVYRWCDTNHMQACGCPYSIELENERLRKIESPGFTLWKHTTEESKKKMNGCREYNAESY